MNLPNANEIVPDDVIFELFGFRCVRCDRPSVTIHEIIPRSQAPKVWKQFKNRVTLCNDCHTHIHRFGARNFVEELNAYREFRLSKWQ